METNNNNKFIIPVIVAVIVLIIGTAYLASRDTATDDSSTATTTATVASSTIPAAVSTTTSPIIKTNNSNVIVRQISETKVPMVTLSATTSKEKYGPSENVKITVKAQNNSDIPATVYFPAGCMITYSIGSYTSPKGAGCPGIEPTEIVIKPHSFHLWYITHNPETYILARGAQDVKVTVSSTDDDFVNTTATTSVYITR